MGFNAFGRRLKYRDQPPPFYRRECLERGWFPAPTLGDAGRTSLSRGCWPERWQLCAVWDRCALDVLFQLPCPSRHAARQQSFKPQPLLARRPGIFALVIDCMSARITAHCTRPEGRAISMVTALSLRREALPVTQTEND